MEKSELYCKEPLLMLRAVEMYTEGGYAVPENIRNGILANAEYLRNADREKIRILLDTVITRSFAESFFRELFYCGVLKIILPELDRCFYEPQRNKYHIYNVGEHILHTLSASPPLLSVRWAALLHDVGKPLCASIDANDIIHFYGHHAESVKIARDICYRYSFPEALRREICILIDYHDVHFEQSIRGVKRALAKMGETVFKNLLDLQAADALAKTPSYAIEKRDMIEELREICKAVICSGEPYRYSDLAIGKRDLIKMKYRADHQMRDVLRRLFDEIIENPSLNNREYLLSRARKLKSVK